jgi:S-adenosylmethionine synthetase
MSKLATFIEHVVSEKLVIDHYGRGVPIGGDALAGKDPHKADNGGRCGLASWRRNWFAEVLMRHA